jgi:hypothetical protein
MVPYQPPPLPPFHGRLYLVVWYDASNVPIGAAIRGEIPTGPLQTGGGWSPVVTHTGSRPFIVRTVQGTGGDLREATDALLNAVRTDPSLAFLRGDAIRGSELWYDLRGIVVGRPLPDGDGLPRLAPLAKRTDWT